MKRIRHLEKRPGGSILKPMSGNLRFLGTREEETPSATMDNHGDGGSSGVSNTCPICIGPFCSESYLDKCFRTFFIYIPVQLL